LAAVAQEQQPQRLEQLVVVLYLETLLPQVVAEVLDMQPLVDLADLAVVAEDLTQLVALVVQVYLVKEMLAGKD
jgi:hypothetical protein